MQALFCCVTLSEAALFLSLNAPQAIEIGTVDACAKRATAIDEAVGTAWMPLKGLLAP
jgi:hypothetical protein